MTTDPVRLLRTFVDGYNDRSLHESAEDIFAPEIVFVNKTIDSETRGLDTFIQHTLDGWVSVVPDARIELLDYQIDGDTVTCTMKSAGTFEGTMETPDGPIPGTGKYFELEFNVDVSVDGGRITRWVSEYDMNDWKRQVGITERTS